MRRGGVMRADLQDSGNDERVERVEGFIREEEVASG
jgi:hypothetical protein